MTPEERAQAFLDMYDIKGYNPIYVGMLAQMIYDAEADEREACAKIADSCSDALDDHEAGAAVDIAQKIRARSVVVLPKRPQTDTHPAE
jgi:hypothetical protein